MTTVLQLGPLAAAAEAALEGLRARAPRLPDPAALRDLLPEVRALIQEIGARPVLVVAAGGTGIVSEALGARVLDSSLPESAREGFAGFDVLETVFILQSRAGADSELNPFFRHLREGGAKHFVALAGAGSSLPSLAEHEKFSRTIVAPEGSGSALFALTAAALAEPSIDLLETFLSQNPGGAADEAFLLGAALAACALHKPQARDKLTFLLSEKLLSLGTALEQFVARATGKDGKGLVPVDEPLAPPALHGKDRAFAALWLGGKHARTQERKLDKLLEAGHPVISREVKSPLDELLFWERAAAAAAHALSVDPEAEPDLWSGKDLAKALLAQVSGGKLPVAEPAIRADGLALFATPEHAQLLRRAAGTLGLEAAASPIHWLAAHLAMADEGDEIALRCWFPPSARDLLRKARLAVRAATRLPVTVGLGPRYLHSTGQLLKGGPSGVTVLLATFESKGDLPVPGMPFGFATLTEAQARGDEEALALRGRRLLRAHVEGNDWTRFFAALDAAVALITK